MALGRFRPALIDLVGHVIVTGRAAVASGAGETTAKVHVADQLPQIQVGWRAVRLRIGREEGLGIL
jgi:hypothetical protein